MNDKKHIDRLFQERFKDFEVTPDDAVWKRIEAELNQKKKKRRIIPIWWRYAGVAALLLLLLTITYFNTSEEKLPTNDVVNTEEASSENKTRGKNISNENKEGASETKTVNTDNNDANKALKNSDDKSTIEKSQNKLTPNTQSTIAESATSKNQNESKINKATHKLVNLTSNNAVANLSEKENSNQKALQNKTANNTALATLSGTESKKDTTSVITKEQAKELINNTSKPNTAIADNKAAKTEPLPTIEKENKTLTIEEALEKNKDLIEEEKEKQNRWSIAPNAAPVYFNTLGEGSSIDPQFNKNSKSGELNMSYGISASYAINNKITVRSGINKVNLGYNTNDVIVFQSAGLSSRNLVLQSVNSVKSLSNDNAVSIISAESFKSARSFKSIGTSNTSINQALGYIEVPLEIQYKLSDKKLGINVIGGFSSFFLNNNEIFSEAENGNRIFLGEANNINNVSYSANFGLGFNYQVSNRIGFNLEPMFKYQINTFKNISGDFTPFFIGVYTGFAINF